MSSLWFNIRFLNWFLQIGPDWPWVVIEQHPDMEAKEWPTKFAIYIWFGKQIYLGFGKQP